MYVPSNPEVLNYLYACIYICLSATKVHEAICSTMQYDVTHSQTSCLFQTFCLHIVVTVL